MKTLWFIVAISLPNLDSAVIVDGPAATYEACKMAIRNRFEKEPGRIDILPGLTMYACMGTNDPTAIGSRVK